MLLQARFSAGPSCVGAGWGCVWQLLAPAAAVVAAPAGMAGQGVPLAVAVGVAVRGAPAAAVVAAVQLAAEGSEVPQEQRHQLPPAPAVPGALRQ